MEDHKKTPDFDLAGGEFTSLVAALLYIKMSVTGARFCLAQTRAPQTRAGFLTRESCINPHTVAQPWRPFTAFPY